MKYFKEDAPGWAGVSLALAVGFYITLKNPPLFASFLSGKNLSICYVIVLLLWEELPLCYACTEAGGLLEFCGHIIVPVLFFAVSFFQRAPLWGVLAGLLWLLSLLWFIYCSVSHRKSCQTSQTTRETTRKICIRFGVLMAVILLAVPAFLGFFGCRTAKKMPVSANRPVLPDTFNVEHIDRDSSASAGAYHLPVHLL